MLRQIHERIWYVIGEVFSIIWARFTAFTGLITMAIGAMDWSPLLNFFGTTTEFSTKQLIGLGAVTFLHGIVAEIGRRHNDPLLKVTTAAEAAPEVAKAKKQIKKVLKKTPEVK